jgi:hypothetical protein
VVVVASAAQQISDRRSRALTEIASAPDGSSQ